MFDPSTMKYDDQYRQIGLTAYQDSIYLFTASEQFYSKIEMYIALATSVEVKARLIYLKKIDVTNGPPHCSFIAFELSRIWCFIWLTNIGADYVGAWGLEPPLGNATGSSASPEKLPKQIVLIFFTLLHKVSSYIIILSTKLSLIYSFLLC